MTAHHIVAGVGLLFDIAGGIFVVRGLLWASDDELARASDRVGAWADPKVPGLPQVFPRPELLKLFRESRRDARVGAALLVVGFLAQLAAVLVI